MPEPKRRDHPSIYLRYSSALVFTLLATLIRVLTMRYIGPRFTYTSFIVSLILTCWYGGLGPGLVAGVLGGLLGAFYAQDVLASRPGGYIIIATFIVWAMHALQRANQRLEEETVERLRLQEVERRERQWSHITLSSIGDAVITTDSSGHVNFMNAVAESLIGWTSGDAKGKPLEEVFQIVNEKTRTAMENPVERVLREGVIVGLANHAVLVRRDGVMVPIDDSAAPVRDESGAIIGAVLVFRDVTERRRTMLQIQTSQERLGLAMEAGSMGTWDWDIRTGKVQWSANLERIHGMQPGSFGGGFDDFEKSVHPDDRERVVSVMKTAADDGDPYRLEYRILQPGGGIAWLEARARVMLDERGEPSALTGVCVDITARKLADEELRQRLAQQNAVARLGALALSTRDVSKLFQTAAEVVAHELHVELAAILEAMPDGSLVRRAKWGWPDDVPDLVLGGRESQPGYTMLASAPVVMENFDAEQRFQHSPELAALGIASGISVVIPGEERAFGVLAAYSTRRRAFTPEDTQFAQAVANITANTVRRQSEEEARARLAAVLESSADAIISHNLDGIVDTWNRGAEQVYGYRAAEMIGRSMSVLLPADKLSEEVSLLEIVRRGEGVQAFETVRVRKDGTPIHVSLTISPIRDLAGKVIAGSHSGRDISERKRVEENLQQTQKLESLGILAGGIAHDFNNLLTGILGNASLISEALPSQSPARALTESVIQAADRAAHLTRQMLAYSGRGRFLIQPINCSQQVREITALIAASIPKNVQVRMALAGDLPFIEGDTGQFQQLVMNLVINGAEAVGEGPGTVTISTELEDLSAQAIAGLTFASGLKPGRYVSLEVRDTGCGMDAATLARIFDPFFTTKFTGRGLGLAAVLGIVRGHSGAVNVRSTPGRGTNFQVLFPVVEAPKMQMRDAIVAAAGAGGGVILVVDDEDMVRRAARASLEKYGYKVVLAEDGKHAVDVLTSLDHTISGVLLDMTMPGMSGEQTFQEMRRIRPDLPVIASSGFSEAEAVARFGLGISGFVQKPYTAAVLAAKIAEVMAVRRSGDSAGLGGERT